MSISLEYDKRQISAVFIGSLLILLFALLVYLVRPVLGAFGLTVVFAYILHPVVEFLLPWVKRRSIAIFLTSLFILVPFFVFTVYLTSTLIAQLVELSKVDAVQNLVKLAGTNLKPYLATPPSDINLGFSAVSGLTRWFFASLQTLGSFFLQLFLAIFFSSYVLYKEEDVVAFVESVRDEKIKSYIAFVDHALQQVVYSMFLTAFVTGLVATVVYLIFGIPFAVLLATTTGFVALVPMIGTWFIYGPVGVYYILQGDPSRGILLLGVSAVFVSVLPDVVVRPFFASRKERINLGALMLGFVTGVLAFGSVGVVLGPLIIISLTGIVRIFLFDETHSLDGKNHIKKVKKSARGK